MFTFIIDALRAHWLGAVVGTSVLAVFTTVSLQRIEITQLKKQAQICRLENTALMNANKALAGSIETQNAAITLWQAKAVAKAKKSQNELLKARADAQRFAAKAKQIEAQRSGGSECADMKRLVEDYLAAGSKED